MIFVVSLQKEQKNKQNILMYLNLMLPSSKNRKSSLGGEYFLEALYVMAVLWHVF